VLAFARTYLVVFISLFIYVVLSLFISIIMDAYEVVKVCDLAYPGLQYPQPTVTQERHESLVACGNVSRIEEFIGSNSPLQYPPSDRRAGAFEFRALFLARFAALSALRRAPAGVVRKLLPDCQVTLQ